MRRKYSTHDCEYAELEVEVKILPNKQAITQSFKGSLNPEHLTVMYGEHDFTTLLPPAYLNDFLEDARAEWNIEGGLISLLTAPPLIGYCELQLEVNWETRGTYSPGTHESPPEYPEKEIVSAMLNGADIIDRLSKSDYDRMYHNICYDI